MLLRFAGADRSAETHSGAVHVKRASSWLWAREGALTEGRFALRVFEYRHVVAFEETNLVGNVYYVNHLRWQGRCRELFLREHAPEVLDLLRKDFALVTVRCSCEYLVELDPFDEIIVRMRLASMLQNRISLTFEYWRETEGGEQLVARGEHEVACMRRQGETAVPINIPDTLRAALELYSP